MGCVQALCHLLFVLSALFTGLVSYYMYQNIPDSTDSPWLVRSWLGTRQFVDHVSLVGERLNINNRLMISRRIYDTFHKYRVQSQPETPKLKISDSLFGEIPVRLYEPTKRKSPGPAILYIHGGGWTMGSLDYSDKICRELASRSAMLIVSISYSLAPEDPFPQGLDDCENATSHFMKYADVYGVDKGRIALAGDDTGANLAAALALRSRDRPWKHQPKLQILLYPILQIFDFNSPSYTQNRQVLLPLNNPLQIAKNTLYYTKQDPNAAHALVVNNHTSVDDRERYGNLVSYEFLAEKFRQDYQPLNHDGFDVTLAKRMSSHVLHPHVAPLMYGNGKLHKIAKAYIATMEHDSVRDDGMIYARRVRQSGGKAVLKHYDTGYHDCLNLLGHTQLSEQVVNDLVNFVTKDL